MGQQETVAKRILVPVEQVEAAKQVISKLTELPNATQAELLLLHVYEPLPFTPPEIARYRSGLAGYPEAAKDRGKALLEECSEYASAHGLKVDRQLIESGYTVDTIVQQAKEQHADWIAMAAHQRHGVSRWFIGSVTERVAAAASQPVLTVPFREGKKRESPS